ncbi:MAG: hypothetical protein AAGN66_10870 [Acidobacteriota bacterium]
MRSTRPLRLSVLVSALALVGGLALFGGLAPDSEARAPRPPADPCGPLNEGCPIFTPAAGGCPGNVEPFNRWVCTELDQGQFAWVWTGLQCGPGFACL